MAHLIDKDALVAELKKRVREYWNDSENTMGIYPYALEEVIKYVDTLEVKELDLDNYNKVKRTLSLSFMNFLDANCPEGKMCLSNGECFDIDKAFDELDFAKLFRYMEKYFKTQKEIK